MPVVYTILIDICVPLRPFLLCILLYCGLLAGELAYIVMLMCVFDLLVARKILVHVCLLLYHFHFCILLYCGLLASELNITVVCNIDSCLSPFVSFPLLHLVLLWITRQ